jgi:hypothetical protein
LIYHAGWSVGVSEESDYKVEFEVGFVLMIIARNVFLGGVGNDERCKIGHGVDDVGKHSLDAVDKVGSSSRWNESAGASAFVSVNSDRTRCDPRLTVVRLMICIHPYARSIQSS